MNFDDTIQSKILLTPSEGLVFSSNKNGTCTLKKLGKCRDLDIVIPKISPTGETVTVIGKKAFAGCKKLTSVRFPDTIIAIGEGAFKQCESLIQITLPANIQSVEKEAFSGCNSLLEISLPDSLTCIGEHAFENCNQLKSIVLPNGITEIKKKTFSSCCALTSITLPETLTNIFEYAFENCNGIKTIVVPDSVIQIGFSAFAGCSSLTKITLPFLGPAKNEETASKKTHLGYIFGTKQYVGSVSTETLPEWKTGRDSTLYYLPNALKEVTITGGVIFREAFKNCQRITSILLGDGVTAIQSSAFVMCKNLKSIHIGTGVKTLSNSFFSNCPNLKDVFLSNGLTHIEGHAFSDISKITSITIPSSVTFIEHWAFSVTSNPSQIIFENPNNWKVQEGVPHWHAECSFKYTSTEFISLSSSDLTNPSTASQYLHGTYHHYNWYHNS